MKHFVVLILVLLAHLSFAQISISDTSSVDSTKIILEQASLLEVDNLTGKEIRYLKGSDTAQVIFKHLDSKFYCDNAIQYADSNFVKAYGNILFNDADSILLTGDTLFYDGNLRLARIIGKEVVLTDQNTRLITNVLYYDLTLKKGYYLENGKVEDDSTILTSKRGYYYANTKDVTFGGDVKLKAEDSDYELFTDTLTYNTTTEKAFFHTKTKIINKENTLYAESGEYDAKFSVAKFQKNAQIETKEYILKGDDLVYDEVTEKGFGKGNVFLYSKKDSISVWGERVKYDGLNDISHIYGNVLMSKPFAKDTLFLLADTIISVQDTAIENRKLFAFHNVSFLTNDLQGACDSLVYTFSDSAMRFFGEPILWSGESQITADTITALLENQEIHQLLMKNNALIVSKDILETFNQVSGREMIVDFQKRYLEKVTVTGNGESIYFAFDMADSSLIAMNYVICSNILIHFGDSNKLKEITFIKQPESKFIPPQELKDDEKYLENFVWFSDKRPSKNLVSLRKTGSDKIESITKNLKPLSDYPYQIYLSNDSLIFVAPNATPALLSHTFFVDVIPENLSDLPENSQIQRYQHFEFEISEDYIQKNKLLYVFRLPKYPIFTVRTGQFFMHENKPMYQWANVFNLYDLK